MFCDTLTNMLLLDLAGTSNLHMKSGICISEKVALSTKAHIEIQQLVFKVPLFYLFLCAVTFLACLPKRFPSQLADSEVTFFKRQLKTKMSAE